MVQLSSKSGKQGNRNVPCKLKLRVRQMFEKLPFSPQTRRITIWHIFPFLTPCCWKNFHNHPVMQHNLLQVTKYLIRSFDQWVKWVAGLDNICYYGWESHSSSKFSSSLELYVSKLITSIYKCLHASLTFARPYSFCTPYSHPSLCLLFLHRGLTRW